MKPSEKLINLFQFIFGIALFGILVCWLSDAIFGTEWFDSYVVHYFVYLVVGFFAFLGIALLYWIFIGWWYEAY